MVKIWGGTAAVEPFSSGLNSFCQDVACSSNSTTPETLLDVSQAFFEDENDESLITADKDVGNEQEVRENSRKRKPAANKVPKHIYKKRKRLEKALSAAQRDQMLTNEAKEDIKFRKQLSESMKQSSSLFSEAIKDNGKSMKQIGEGISRCMELLAHSMVRNRPQNQNLFYQNCPHLNPSGSAYSQNI